MYHVTEILGNLNFRAWPYFIKDAERDFYLRRGSMIHKATALYDEGVLDWDTVDERILPFILAWKRFREEASGKVTAIELSVVNQKLGYVGTLDRIITKCNLHPSGHLLLDIKTNEADIFTRLQTMAYAMAQKRTVKRGYVELKNDGTYRAEVYDNDSVDQAGWMACLQLNSWKVRNEK